MGIYTASATIVQAGDVVTRTVETRGAVQAIGWTLKYLFKNPTFLILMAGVELAWYAVVVGLATSPGVIRFLSYVVSYGLTVWFSGVLALGIASSVYGYERGVGAVASATATNLVSGIITVFTLQLVVSMVAFLGLVEGFLLFVVGLPTLYVLVRLSMVVPAIFVDSFGIGGALKRSWTLTRGKTTSVLGVSAGVSLFGLLSFVPDVGVWIGLLFAVPVGVGAMTNLYLSAGGGTQLEYLWENDSGTTTVTATTDRASSDPSRSRGTSRDAVGADRPGDPGTPMSTSSATDSRDTTTQGAAPDRGTQPSESEPTNRDSRTDARPDSGTKSGATAGGATGMSSSTGTTQSSDGDSGPTDDEGTSDDAEEGGEEEEVPDPPDDVVSEEDIERVDHISSAVSAGDADPERVEQLVELLDSESPEVRRDAARALERLSTDYPEAVAESLRPLQEARLDPDVGVSQAAASAVKEIERTRHTGSSSSR